MTPEAAFEQLADDLRANYALICRTIQTRLFICADLPCLALVSIHDEEMVTIATVLLGTRNLQAKVR